ncbi:MAG: hypothetical protein R3308_05805, partial [Thiohalobacterales bacterium]|nr:hypothetical protein [Thiohalobacterales bacterium]
AVGADRVRELNNHWPRKPRKGTEKHHSALIAAAGAHRVREYIQMLRNSRTQSAPTALRFFPEIISLSFHVFCGHKNQYL